MCLGRSDTNGASTTRAAPTARDGRPDRPLLPYTLAYPLPYPAGGMNSSQVVAMRSTAAWKNSL